MRVNAWPLLRETAKEWMDDKGPRLGAAVAFYSVLSLAPLLVIMVAMASAFFGEDAARGRIVEQIQTFVGKEGAQAVQATIVNARALEAGKLATLLGLVAILFGASGVFAELQDALNTIWEVPPRPGSGLFVIIRSRFVSFAMVLITGLLLLASLISSAVLTALSHRFSARFPGIDTVWSTINSVSSFVIVTAMFALIFRFVPDADIHWRDVWLGALLTSLLFTIGKGLIGAYLGRASIGSAYGAAGSLVVLLVWTYYSAQILFFGAEFTHVCSRRRRAGLVHAAAAP